MKISSQEELGFSLCGGHGGHGGHGGQQINKNTLGRRSTSQILETSHSGLLRGGGGRRGELPQFRIIGQYLYENMTFLLSL